MSGLNNFKKIYSQYGEDGIIEEVLKRLDNHLDLTCCEFEPGMGSIYRMFII